MQDVNLLLCGNLWQSLGDQRAGWELIRCLQSHDPQVRDAAHEYLVEAGPRSVKLLQAAILAGALDDEVAVDCMIALFAYVRWETRSDEPFDSLYYDC